MQDRDLTLAQQGDPAAFERLVTPHLQGLFAFIRRRAGNEAEDVYQETLLGAWRAIGGFAGSSSLKTWLYAIAGYKCQDCLRRKARAPVTGEANETLGDEGFEEGSLLKMDLDSALKRLPEGDRSLLQLVYAEGFTLREAAGVLGIPEGTAKSRLHRLRTTLQAAMGGGNDGD